MVIEARGLDQPGGLYGSDATTGGFTAAGAYAAAQPSRGMAALAICARYTDVRHCPPAHYWITVIDTNAERREWPWRSTHDCPFQRSSLPRHRCALCEASRRMARGEHCRRDRQQPLTAVGDRARPARTLEPRQLGVTDRRRLDRSLLRALRRTHALLDPRWHTAPSSAEMTASKVGAQAS